MQELIKHTNAVTPTEQKKNIKLRIYKIITKFQNYFGIFLGKFYISYLVSIR